MVTEGEVQTYHVPDPQSAVTQAQQWLHKVPVIFHENFQRQSHKPYGLSYISHMIAASKRAPPQFRLRTHTDLSARFQIASLGSQTLHAPEAGDFVDLLLLYIGIWVQSSACLHHQGIPRRRICCVHWYTGTQVPEEMHVPFFRVVKGSRMQSYWNMRSAYIFRVRDTLKTDAAKAYTNPHDVVFQKPGVLTSAAVITSYLITSVLLLPVIHCPSARPMIQTHAAVLLTLIHWV